MCPKLDYIAYTGPMFHNRTIGFRQDSVRDLTAYLAGRAKPQDRLTSLPSIKLCSGDFEMWYQTPNSFLLQVPSEQTLWTHHWHSESAQRIYSTIHHLLA